MDVCGADLEVGCGGGNPNPLFLLNILNKKR